MHVYFQMLDSLLASEVLPPEYAGRMQQVHYAHALCCCMKCHCVRVPLCLFDCLVWPLHQHT